VVCDYKDRPKEAVRKDVEEHFRTVSQDQPFWRRVKVLRFWEGELPRTSTRKVKRKLVVEELKRLERVAAAGDKARAKAAEASADWLYALVAEVAQKSAGEVRGDSRFTGDLGFDSLMMTELQVALENAGVAVNALGDLTRLQTVDELRRAVAATGRRPASEVKAKEVSKVKETEKSIELELPEAVSKLGKAVLGLGQKAIYGGVFKVKTTGKSFIPQNRNFLVVANHASHLDMGLVKVVLGAQGERLVALAAKDYFFDTPLKRAYFENFTNLIPMERKGSLRESLRMAGEALKQGYNLLIFPEGTRSVSGELGEFYPTLGFLALSYEVDVLPCYLKGTYEALPKGGVWPKNTELEVRFGPPLSYDDLKARVEGLARSESYRRVTKVAEEAVRALKAGRTYVPAELEADVVEVKVKRVGPPPPPQDEDEEAPPSKAGPKTPPRMRAKGEG
jgi:long-chain acyl-CoA synthetase